jgi:hypothetical protein
MPVDIPLQTPPGPPKAVDSRDPLSSARAYLGNLRDSAELKRVYAELGLDCEPDGYSASAAIRTLRGERDRVIQQIRDWKPMAGRPLL